MTTKQDVINAALKYGVANYEMGLLVEDESAPELVQTEEEAYEHFKKTLDEFEQTLLNKEK